MLSKLRLAALQAALASSQATLSRFRLGIGATLSIAFAAVAVLAAAANLISERGSQIINSPPVSSPAPATAAAVHKPTPASAPQVITLPASNVAADQLLAAIARYELAAQSHSLTRSGSSAHELQMAAETVQRAADRLLDLAGIRRGTQERRTLINHVLAFHRAGAELAEQADTERTLLMEYSTQYEAMHTHARASIEAAWKIFGRVVARQTVVTLNSQVEDLGRLSANLIANGGNSAAAAAALETSEKAVAATLAENERSLIGSQGKEWVLAMSNHLAALASARQKLLQVEVAERASREQLAQTRRELEARVGLVATPKVAPASQLTRIDETALPRSQREHPSPRFSTMSVKQAAAVDDQDGKRVIAWISCAVLLLLILICISTVRRVVGPVRRLVRATARLAEGDLDARVPAGGIKELDTLAIAFNEMAEQLAHAQRITRDYQAELETRVQERTEQLKVLASNDPLTSLPNRRELFVLLNDALQRASEADDYVGVFFLDLDNFKNINDGMGHAFGDQVLQATASRLRAVAAEFGFAARLGGDEFTVVMTDAASLEDIRAAGMRLVNAFDTPITAGNRDLMLSVSVGASVFPDHERNADALLRAADAAVFRAKALGRSQLTMYSPELLATAAAKFTIEQGLRTALEKEEFELVFQPELSLSTMQVELVEALIRWRQPDGRLATPGEFLAVAEESGLIMDISDWVLRTAIATAARWHHGSWPQARVAINVSSRQLIDATFVERMRALLLEYRLPARCIEIELTESVLQTGPVTLEALRQLRAHGITIALDDFGTGYSSLASLQQLPLSRIKLDRSLLDDIDTSARSLSITRSIIALSRSLDLEVTAEGIERAEQLALLLGEGPLLVQGFLLSRPVPEHELIDALSGVALRSQTLLLPAPAAQRNPASSNASEDHAAAHSATRRAAMDS